MRIYSVIRVGAVSLLFASIIGRAEGQDGYGTEWVYDRNVKLVASIGGVTSEGMKISGTRVEIIIEVGMEMPIIPPDPPPPPFEGEPWSSFIVTYVALTIGGETVGLPQEFAQWDPYQRLVRFASTHFPDQSTIAGALLEIRLTARLKGLRTDPWGNVIESGPVRELVPIVKPKVYNRALLLATVEEVINNQYVIQNPPPPPNSLAYSATSQRGTSSARTRFGFMNHTVYPTTSGSEKDLREIIGLPNLDGLLEESTVFFGFTHGESTHFRASHTDELFWG